MEIRKRWHQTLRPPWSTAPCQAPHTRVYRDVPSVSVSHPSGFCIRTHRHPRLLQLLQAPAPGLSHSTSAEGFGSCGSKALSFSRRRLVRIQSSLTLLKTVTSFLVNPGPASPMYLAQGCISGQVSPQFLVAPYWAVSSSVTSAAKESYQLPHRAAQN